MFSLNRMFMLKSNDSFTFLIHYTFNVDRSCVLQPVVYHQLTDIKFTNIDFSQRRVSLQEMVEQLFTFTVSYQVSKGLPLSRASVRFHGVESLFDVPLFHNESLDIIDPHPRFEHFQTLWRVFPELHSHLVPVACTFFPNDLHLARLVQHAEKKAIILGREGAKKMFVQLRIFRKALDEAVHCTF